MDGIEKLMEIYRWSCDNDGTALPLPPAFKPEHIEPGILCQVHGLKSASSQKLNGRRCAILGIVNGEGGADCRWKVQMEQEDNISFAENKRVHSIPEKNLKILTRLQLPTGFDRGKVDMAKAMRDMTSMVPKLCELLVYPKDRIFEPSEIMLLDYPGMALRKVNSSNLTHFTTIQLEQMAGMLSLSDVCVQQEDRGAKSVLFGLLEGDPMYIDVLIQLITCTSLIVREGTNVDHDVENKFYKSQMSSTKLLSPDQDSAPYTKCMAEGPMKLFTSMLNYQFKDALWAAISKSEFYHLFIQRLLRWVAREAQNTLDGRYLGPNARKILIDILPAINVSKDRPVTGEIASLIIEKSPLLLKTPRSITVQRVNSCFV